MHEQNDLQSVSESGGKPPFLQTGEQLLLQLHLRIGIYEINRRFHEVTAPGWINTVAHTTGSGSGVSSQKAWAGTREGTAPPAAGVQGIQHPRKFSQLVFLNFWSKSSILVRFR